MIPLYNIHEYCPRFLGVILLILPNYFKKLQKRVKKVLTKKEKGGIIHESLRERVWFGKPSKKKV